AGLNRPTYTWLASLPTDPGALLRRLAAEISADQDARDTPAGERDPDQDAFEAIGELLRETLMPPRTAAALYKAAARIPGVSVDADAVDAAGRHGVAIGREDAGPMEPLIFHKKTKAFLGEREGAVRDAGHVKKGDLLGVSAVMHRTVVDGLGQQP
ncbi:CU044_5270 family protein, partial [Streptomyces sp. DT225]